MYKIIYFIFCIILLIQFSCKENPQEANKYYPIILNSFSPELGCLNSKVTIYGKHFISDSVQSVSINNVNAKIELITDDSIIIFTPQTDFGKYRFIVKSKDSTYFSDKFFEVIDCQFELTSFFPKSGCINSKVVLYGHNFIKDSIISVSFNDKVAQIDSINNDSMIVLVPNVGFGKVNIKVKSKFGAFTFNESFEVVDCQIQLLSFSPNKGCIGSSVILFGNNFIKDSVLDVYFNDAESKMEFVTNDSIGVVVPNISTGFVKIKVKSISKSLEFNDWYEVEEAILTFDYTKLIHYSISYNNLHVAYRNFYESQSIDEPPNITDDTVILFNYGKYYKSSGVTYINVLGPYEYNLYENTGYINPAILHIKIDTINNIFDSLNFNMRKYTNMTDEHVDWYNFTLNLCKIPITIISDSLITIKITNKNSDISFVSLSYSEEGNYHSGHSSSEYWRGIQKLLDFTDSTSIIVQLSK